MDYDSDVIVIGAGPAGSTSAQLIAEAGYNVLLLEKDHVSGESSACGGAIPLNTAEEFGIPDSIIEEKVAKSYFYFPNSAHAQDHWNASFHRSVFDRYLAQRAVEKGARIMCDTVAVQVNRQADSICVKTQKRRSGETMQLKSKLLIFADGPATLAHKSLGIGFGADPHQTYHAIVCEVDDNNHRLPALTFFFDRKISPWGYGWIFPKKNGLNVGVGGLMSAMLNEKSKLRLRERLDYFMSSYPLSSDLLKGKKPLNTRAKLIPMELAKQIHAERSLLVGDAAGMDDAVWGGGIEFAMKGARIVAKCAVDALQNERFDAEFLSRYEVMYRSSPAAKRLRRLSRATRFGLFYSRFNQNALISFYKVVLWRMHAYRMNYGLEAMQEHAVNEFER